MKAKKLGMLMCVASLVGGTIATSYAANDRANRNSRAVESNEQLERGTIAQGDGSSISPGSGPGMELLAQNRRSSDASRKYGDDSRIDRSRGNSVGSPDSTGVNDPAVRPGGSSESMR